jgi:endonuclease/exonuclease/phosphatase family metal-dependent hydrolase
MRRNLVKWRAMLGARVRRVAAMWLRALFRALGVAYPVALLGVILLFRWVGEAWWLTAAALYVPRIVFALPLPLVALGLLALRFRRLLLLQLASVALVVFPLMGLVLPWFRSAEQGAPTVRLLSFNVNSSLGGAEAVKAEIDRYTPDVVLLQEVDDGGRLARLLRPEYPTVETWDQFVVATRYPVTSKLIPDPLSFEGKGHHARFVKHVMETPLGRVAFYDVHPISPRQALYTMRGVRNILGGRSAALVRENAGLRTLQVKTIAEAAAADVDPVVIAGDTNLPGLSEIRERYLGGYHDGFEEASWGFGYTFPANKWRPWMRIDRILTTRQLRFARFEVGHSKVSDHLCVFAELQRKGP